MLCVTVVILLIHAEVDSSGKCRQLFSFPTETLAGSLIGGVVLAIVLGVAAFFTTYCCRKHLNTKHVSRSLIFKVLLWEVALSRIKFPSACSVAVHGHVHWSTFKNQVLVSSKPSYENLTTDKASSMYKCRPSINVISHSVFIEYPCLWGSVCTVTCFSWCCVCIQHVN